MKIPKDWNVLTVLVVAAVLGMAAGLGSVNAASAKTALDKKPALPKLVDLGADKCIPCKMMAPVLQRLKKDYAGQMDVQFIDVWKDPSAGDPYKIKIIPTQIFFDPTGKELFRHEGFFGEEEILKKWKELGFTFNRPTPKAK